MLCTTCNTFINGCKRGQHASITITSTFTHPFSANTEQWRDIRGCSKYSVSSLGNIKIKKTNKYLKMNILRFKSLNKPVQCVLDTDLGTRRSFLINRLVLNTFQPNPDSHHLYARRKDANKYNNTLSNLYWSNTTRSYAPPKLIAVQLKHPMHGYITFESITDCQHYLKCIDIRVASTTITTWCKNRNTKHGYKFEWHDVARYEKTAMKQVPVVDLENEEWKCFYVTPATGVKRYISSYGRLKSINKHGKERLLSTYWSSGYYLTVGYLCPGEISVHRIVAKAFIPNPHNYEMIDHKDADTTNNRASNLRWVQNMVEQYKLNAISRQKVSQSKTNRWRADENMD
eukprot:928306_1